MSGRTRTVVERGSIAPDARSRGRHRTALATAALFGVLPALPACAATVQPSDARPELLAAADGDQPAGWLRPAATADRLVLVGDSLAQEVAPILQYVTPGKELVTKYWGGTAPCDWTGVGLDATSASVVVISFTGNSLTDCMSDGAGGFLVDEELVDRYRVDIAMLVDKARRAGARVLLVGQPKRAPSFDADVEVAGINAVYQELAAAHRYVSYIDAGHAVETPEGDYAERLPCTEFDTDCAADGTTVVRGDGVHFCPMVGENPCPVWSSGAFRFGLAIATAADAPQDYD